MKLFIGLISATLLANVAFAAEKQLPWPRFRGPNGSGIAEGAKPPVDFGPDKNLKWKAPAPRGLSSPIIAGDKLVITAFEGGKLYTIAYQTADGKEGWRREAPAKQIEKHHKTEGSPAASTSATDGQRIVSYFGSCGLFCYDLSGTELWKFELPPAATAGDFGTGVSPILEQNTVILVRDETQDPKIIALDAATGSLKWQTKRLSRASYCTPVVCDTADGKQIVAAGHARMAGYEFSTGAEKWFFDGIPSMCCPSPVVSGDTLFFAGGSGGGPDDKEMQMPSFDDMLKNLDKDKDGAISREEGQQAFEGFFDNQDMNKDGKITRDEWDAIMKFMTEGKNSAFAFQPSGTGAVTTSRMLWKATKGLPYIPSAILYGGQFIMVKDGGIVTAYDPRTGQEIYQERALAAGKYFASPVAANGNIYFVSLDDGAVTVLKAGTPKPEIVRTNPKLGERTATTPAIAGDVLFIRTDQHLYAFAEKK